MHSTKAEEEQGLFFILNMLLTSFKQRDLRNDQDEQGMIEQIYKVFDKWLELHLPTEKRTCRSKGCSSCCFNNPNGITTFDLWVLYIHESEALQRKAHKLREAHDAYLKQHHSNREEQQLKWVQTLTPCPFLEQDSCSIYTHRPLACRSHFSVNKPEYCHPLYKKFGLHIKKQRTLPLALYDKFFQQTAHPKDFFGACLWLLDEIKKVQS